VLTPIERLTRTAVHIGRSEDFSVRTGSDRKDEVGILSREFDDMVVKLDASRKALVETARAAGMSEIATGVLHNVGNVLNSVNVSASLVGEKVRGLRSQDLARAMKIVVDSGDDLGRFCQEHPKGKAFYPLLKTLTEQLAKEREALLSEIAAMNEGLDHVKELVKAQQGYAALGSGVMEQVEPARIVESAYGFCSRAVEEVKGLAIARDYGALPQARLDRHRAIEILVNVIQNALQSLRDARRTDPSLELSVTAVGDDRLRFEVTDNGVGIAAENLTRIFAHGFTTKSDGHGFGLHAAANAATEMGGTLTAHSDGPGLGATFTLEVPIQAVPAMAEAA
jgi:signal transduction histidine kinase